MSDGLSLTPASGGGTPAVDLADSPLPEKRKKKPRPDEGYEISAPPSTRRVLSPSAALASDADYRDKTYSLPFAGHGYGFSGSDTLLMERPTESSDGRSLQTGGVGSSGGAGGSGSKSGSHRSGKKRSKRRKKKDSIFPDGTTLQEYLEVRVDSSERWRRRFFVLKNNFLLYAQKHDATEIQSVIYLDGAEVIEGGSGGSRDSDGSGSLDLTFSVRIVNGRRLVHFKVANEESYERWLFEVKKATHLKIKDIYKLIRTLGTSESQNTKVIAARNRKTQQDCAIKIVDKRKCDIVALHSEIQILKTMTHRYIVSMLDLFETKKYLYIVMEECKGGELFDAIADLDGEHYTETDCLTMMHQMARGVQYMHENNIVHRDLKPENVLCVRKNSIEHLKIADFGISKITYTTVKGPQSSVSSSSSSSASSSSSSSRKKGGESDTVGSSSSDASSATADRISGRFDSTGISDLVMQTMKDRQSSTEDHALDDSSGAIPGISSLPTVSLSHYQSPPPPPPPSAASKSRAAAAAAAGLTVDPSPSHLGVGYTARTTSRSERLARGSLDVGDAGSDRAGDSMKTMVGTMTYTAPEVLRGVRYGREVDYWSLGVIMYILLCGYPPYWADSDSALLREIINEEVVFEPEDWTHVSEPIVKLCRGLLCKDPRKRLTTRDILNVTVLKVDKWKRLSMMSTLTTASADDSRGGRRVSTFQSAHSNFRRTHAAMRKASVDVTGAGAGDASALATPSPTTTESGVAGSGADGSGGGSTRLVPSVSGGSALSPIRESHQSSTSSQMKLVSEVV